MQFQVEIRHIESSTDLDALLLVIREQRPHLVDRAISATKVMQQRRQGYRLLAAWREGCIVGFAAYRLQEDLQYGGFVDIDDLLVTAPLQNTGLGERLLKATWQTQESTI